MAKMKIPFGMLGGYKKYVSEYINRIKEKDNGTLQFDWFISSDKTEVEILEVYASSEAALEHQEYLGELQGIIFKIWRTLLVDDLWRSLTGTYRKCKS